MAKSIKLVQAITIGSGGASSVTFSNIPQNFTDLKVVWSARSTASGALAEGLVMTFNGVTSNRSFRRLYGSGSSAGSDNYTNGNVGAIDSAGNTSNTFTNGEAYIPNYTSTNAKSLSVDNVAEDNGSNNELDLMASLWNTSGSGTNITSITLTASFAEFSTFYLYGIGGTKASGGTITSDGTYTYHTFTSSGSFTALEQIKNAEVLCIAGGGGGGGVGQTMGGGGGGAGGLRNIRFSILPAGNTYTATVGAGGSGGAAGNNSPGNQGNNSYFGSVSSTGGGGGGSFSSAMSGSNGGSAGGTTGQAAPYSGNAGGYSPAEGNAGGQTTGVANGDSSQAGAGGGGAGEAGHGGDSISAGTGGAGATYPDWALATGTGVNGYYAGGGGGGGGYYHVYYGGLGGLGGGASGTNTNGGSGSTTVPTAATANTGGGGGGAGADYDGAGGYPSTYGGAGGSGLIIVRYPSE